MGHGLMNLSQGSGLARLQLLSRGLQIWLHGMGLV
jgi:hypothetical protein